MTFITEVRVINTRKYSISKSKGLKMFAISYSEGPAHYSTLLFRALPSHFNQDGIILNRKGLFAGALQ